MIVDGTRYPEADLKQFALMAKGKFPITIKGGRVPLTTLSALALMSQEKGIVLDLSD